MKFTEKYELFQWNLQKNMNFFQSWLLIETQSGSQSDTLQLVFQACADQSISAAAGCLGSKVKEQEEGEQRLLWVSDWDFQPKPPDV